MGFCTGLCLPSVFGCGVLVTQQLSCRKRALTVCAQGVSGSCPCAFEAAGTRPYSAHWISATAAPLLDHGCLVALQGIAYRMLPTATLERWLQLQHSSSRPSSIVAGGAPAGSAVVAHHCVLSLLQRAAQEGSKAAGIAAASCAAEADTLPATLHFRPQ